MVWGSGQGGAEAAGQGSEAWGEADAAKVEVGDGGVAEEEDGCGGIAAAEELEEENCGEGGGPVFEFPAEDPFGVGEEEGDGEEEGKVDEGGVVENVSAGSRDELEENEGEGWGEGKAEVEFEEGGRAEVVFDDAGPLPEPEHFEEEPDACGVNEDVGEEGPWSGQEGWRGTCRGEGHPRGPGCWRDDGAGDEGSAVDHHEEGMEPHGVAAEVEDGAEIASSGEDGHGVEASWVPPELQAAGIAAVAFPLQQFRLSGLVRGVSVAA